MLLCADPQPPVWWLPAEAGRQWQPEPARRLCYSSHMCSGAQPAAAVHHVTLRRHHDGRISVSGCSREGRLVTATQGPHHGLQRDGSPEVELQCAGQFVSPHLPNRCEVPTARNMKMAQCFLMGVSADVSAPSSGRQLASQKLWPLCTRLHGLWLHCCVGDCVTL